MRAPCICGLRSTHLRSSTDARRADGVRPAAFDWLRRMGVHEAYHLDPTNRLIHWICIPLELAAFLKLVGLVPAQVDLGLVAVILVGVVYVAADVGAGVAMTG